MVSANSRSVSITVQPTERFFMVGDVMVRAWHGTDQEGVAVLAMIATVATPRSMEQLVEIPPPDAAEARRWADTILAKATEAGG